ncbi:MAG: iron chelate uptake ABC transporter family permease subunit, partial [Oscillospiraceae bacterium]
MTTNNNAQDIIKKAQVKYRTIILFLIVLPISIFIVSFFLGKYGISPSEFSGVFMGKINDIFTGSPLKIDGSVETVIFKIRLPRLIAATLVGAALSVAGVAYQGMFKNPLVSPDILGASAGAGFGASLA